MTNSEYGRLGKSFYEDQPKKRLARRLVDKELGGETDGAIVSQLKRMKAEPSKTFRVVMREPMHVKGALGRRQIPANVHLGVSMRVGVAGENLAILKLMTATTKFVVVESGWSPPDGCDLNGIDYFLTDGIATPVISPVEFIDVE